MFYTKWAIFSSPFFINPCNCGLLPTIKSSHTYKDIKDEVEISDLARLGPKVDDNQVRRQKHQGMHWSLNTSDSLCALKMLMLNHGWELYWK